MVNNLRKFLQLRRPDIVLDGGKVVETGDHASLIAAKGAYYSLVKNQLELGN